jgi:hypothetical protein
MIDADAQNLGVQSLQTGFVGLVGWDLACSDRCPSHWEERQDDILAPQAAESDFAIQVAG